MTLKVIFDGTINADSAITSLLGIHKFDQLIHRRRNLYHWISMAAGQAGLQEVFHLSSEAHWMEFLASDGEFEANDTKYLVCPANIVALDDVGEIAVLFQQSLHAPALYNIPAVNAPGRLGWALLNHSQLLEYRAGSLELQLQNLLEVSNRLKLLDLNDETALLDFLGGNFDARFFNAVTSDQYVIHKRSTDVGKLTKEYEFHDLLPEEMQKFFVRPYNFREEGGAASYSMERLFIPDMAVQWLHNGMSSDEFKRFLDHVFYFIDNRAYVNVDVAQSEASADALYRGKLLDRIESLKKLDEYRRLEPMFSAAFGGIDGQVSRYLDLIGSVWRDLVSDRLVVGHGDLCFSNMIYSKSSQLLKLIDPRGALSKAELYTNPYYDLAKLSHSVLGNYDFINHDMFELEVNEQIGLKLRLERKSPAWAGQQFASRILDSGFDPYVVRICEASLFLSMLPLHVDRPRKVLAFAMNAVQIMDEIERQ